MFTLLKHKSSKDVETNKWERWFQQEYCLKASTVYSFSLLLCYTSILRILSCKLCDKQKKLKSHNYLFPLWDTESHP